MKLPTDLGAIAIDLGAIAFAALVAAALAGIAASRIQKSLESHRVGNRFEMIRSAFVAFVMSLWVAGVIYITVARIIFAYNNAIS